METLRKTITAFGSGSQHIIISKEYMKARGLKIGDEVEVSLEKASKMKVK